MTQKQSHKPDGPMTSVEAIAYAVGIAGNSGYSLPYEIGFLDSDGKQKMLLITERTGYLDHVAFDKEDPGMPWLKLDLPSNLLARLHDAEGSEYLVYRAD
jgi:hypothetical protein